MALGERIGSAGSCRPALVLKALVVGIWVVFCPLVRPSIRAQEEPGLVINEILASNRLVTPDERGDFEDWIEILNTGPAIGLAGYTVTDDPSFKRRHALPDVVIPAGGRLLVWLSGDDRFVPAPDFSSAAAVKAAFRPVFIDDGDEWRYLIGDPAGMGPPADWNALHFDASEWFVGRSGFGYGDGDDATGVEVNTQTVFLRRTFSVTDPTLISSLALRVDYDDGFVAYLNGTRVAMANSSAPDPDFQSVGAKKHEAGTPEYFDLRDHLDLLQPGENVLAVVGLNTVPSTDMSLIPALGIAPAYVHAGFKLRRGGETVTLLDPDGQVVDRVDFAVQTSDHSFGRSPDGGDEWRYFVTPTPREENAGPASERAIPSEIAVSPTLRMHADPIEVSMHTGAADDWDPPFEVRYTTDGSTPTTSSALYSGPIRVTKDTVFRIAGFFAGVRATHVFSQSFFIGGDRRLPILSLSLPPEDFSFVHLTSEGRGRRAERAAFLEYLQGGDRAIAVGFGLRLHGGASREGGMETKKSYRCYFRGLYGATKLRYALFPGTSVDAFDTLVLRAGFNDAFRTNGRASYLRDELVRYLHEQLGALRSHGAWCALYVNGEYRGVYNLVERLDGDFLRAYTSDDDWDLVKTDNKVVSGSRTEWENLHAFVVNNDLSDPTNYAEVLRRIDLDNFTSYMLLHIWAQNHDWPHNNWYAARPRRPDGRWRFFTWDSEFGLGLFPSGFSWDTFDFALGRNGYVSDLFEALLDNVEFRSHFAHEADRIAFEVLQPNRIVQKIRQLEGTILPEIPRESELFGETPQQWSRNVDECETFVRSRRGPFLDSILNSGRYTFPAIITPRLLAVDPPRVMNVGGVEVVLAGARLGAETLVEFNGVPATSVEETFGTQLRVGVPFDLRLEGSVEIVLTHPGDGSSSTARGLFDVEFPRPLPTEIVPARGWPAGGDRVLIRGARFEPNVTVLFDGVPAPSVERLNEVPMVLEVITPPGEGTANVMVMNHVKGGVVPSVAPLSFRFVAEFRRGDIDGDGQADISDAIRTLNVLFSGGATLRCADAADVNDSGMVDISDPIYLLGFLFVGSTPPRPPFERCGEDLTSDNLSCALGGGC